MLKELLTTCVDLAFPKNCHICSRIFSAYFGKFDDNLCLDCSQGMKKTPASSCSLCGSIFQCNACIKKSPAHKRLLCCYNYEGPVKELLHQFKYNNRPYLSKTIATLMIQALEAYPDLFLTNDLDYLVPIPLHPARQREREFNQSQLIAHALSAYFKKPVLGALCKTKNTLSQTSLEPEKRPLNTQDTFKTITPEAIKNKNILIVDDVVTTSSTLNEASLTLKTSGAGNIYALAFAKG